MRKSIALLALVLALFLVLPGSRAQAGHCQTAAIVAQPVAAAYYVPAPQPPQILLLQQQPVQKQKVIQRQQFVRQKTVTRQRTVIR